MWTKEDFATLTKTLETFRAMMTLMGEMITEIADGNMSSAEANAIIWPVHQHMRTLIKRLEKLPYSPAINPKLAELKENLRQWPCN